MRPKLIALIAVSAVALVGCASGEPVVQPTSNAVASDESLPPEPSPAPISTTPTEDPDVKVEKQFAAFAEARAHQHESVKVPTPSSAIESLHKYCDSQSPINLSKNDKYNENLEYAADKIYCESLETD